MYRVFPSPILIAAIIVCISSVFCLTRDNVLSTRQSLARKMPETAANCYIRINSHQRAASTVLYNQRVVTSGIIGTQKPNAILDSASVVSFLSLVKKTMSRNKGKSAAVVLRTFCEEISKELSIFNYVPLRRKLIFIVHPLLAFLVLYLLSKFLPIMMGTIKKAGNDFSTSVTLSREKAAKGAKLPKRNRSEEALLAAVAAATALKLKPERNRTTANDRIQKLAVEKALKKEEERLATADVKEKVDEQARLRMEISERKVEAQRLAVEQAALRQQEMVRVAREKKADQEKETELRMIGIQAKKGAHTFLLANQKAAREAAGLSEKAAVQAKKEEQLRMQAEKKVLEVEAARVAETVIQAKREEQLRMQAEKKVQEVEAARVAETEIQAKREEQLRMQAEKKVQEVEAARVAETEMQVRRLRTQIELEERRNKAEAALEEEKQALLLYKARVAEEARRQALVKERAKEESRLALLKEKEGKINREAMEEAGRVEKAAQLEAQKIHEEATMLAAKKEREVLEASERARKFEEERQAVVGATLKREGEARAVIAAKIWAEREAVLEEQREEEEDLKALQMEEDHDTAVPLKQLSIRQLRLEKDLNFVFTPQGYKANAKPGEAEDRLLVAIRLVLQANEQANERNEVQNFPQLWRTPHEHSMKKVDSVK